jgi:predicted ArsR family transcriptional regulator
LKNSDAISQRVRFFITDHVDSVGQLEVLLLTQRDAQKEWTAEEVSQELRTNPSWAKEQLADLCAHGLLASREPDHPIYRFDPKSQEMREIVSELANAYSVRRMTVISLIYNKPTTKLQVFADAFKFRKDD